MSEGSPIVPAMAELLARDVPLVLAVSGGVDSMVLLDAAARALEEGRGRHSLVVATFDHGTGAHAAAAVDLVRREAARRALPFETARWCAPLERATEARWRAQRWSFLRDVATRHGAIVATAHTLDDHLETVILRILRGAGVRGMAALLAPSLVARPFVRIPRSEIVRQAQARRLPWLEDPSNASREHLRNRVRSDLLPALRAVEPGIDDALLELSQRAAALRLALSQVARRVVSPRADGAALGGIAVLRSTIASIDAGRELLWQELAALSGVTLDWRGTRRLAAEAALLRDGGQIPLSGGFALVAHRGALSFRRSSSPPADSVDLGFDTDTMYGVWRFSRVSDATIKEGKGAGGISRDPWMAWLPTDRPLTVRAWRSGDRLVGAVGDAPEDVPGVKARRVTRYFADARIAAADRPGWPVVVLGDEVVWVPGVRRSRAATARSGRPGVCIRCERLDH